MTDVDERISDLQSRHRLERTLDEALTTKMRKRGRDVHQVLDLTSVGSRLEDFLDGQLDGEFSVDNLRRLPGGASKEQFLFDLVTPEGTERLVLRMSPPASVLETHRLREFQVLQAIAGTVPVPPARWCITDPAVLGEPALIAGFVTGVAAPTRNAPSKATGLGTAYGEFTESLALQFVASIARIHTFDWTTSDLSAFDKPREGTTDSVDWRLGLLDRTWEEDAFEAHPAITIARQWLWDNRPVVDKVSLLHGDYRNGNFMFDEDTSQITAILDWEMSHLGDRHYDLAYSMLYGYGYTADDGRYLCSGLIDREAYIAEYERVSGLPVDRDTLHYYTILNLYWAVVACSASAPRIAEEKMTHLDVMMNFVPGLGFHFASELTRLLVEEA